MDFLAELQKGLYQTFVLKDNYMYFVRGIRVTLLVTVASLFFGLIIGIVIAIIRSAHDQQSAYKKKNPILGFFNAICKLYLTVIRGTPTMVQLLIICFVIIQPRMVDSELMVVAILTFSINSGAYVAEIIRSGIMSIDPGQMEAGRSLGLNYITTMKNIIIPQAFKNVLPALVNEFITLLKETSIVTVISLKDLTKGAQIIASNTYQAIVPYIALAVIYLSLVLVLSWLLGKLERRLRASDRR